MNTNHLKRFAQEARKKLLVQISAKLEYVLTTDSAELREKTSALKGLQEAINSSSRDQVIEKVAYTWFNRLMALRFMDANDYQPIGIKVMTPKEGFTLPELLDEAKQGNIPNELPLKSQHIYDLLDGNIPSKNPQNEAYKELLIGACNHLHQVFPFLFEKINDFTDLLLPDDLTSEFSIVHDIVDGMTEKDCADVEIIGWLYQFYISERKDELINAKNRYKADEIAPVTQLFTPRWIVEYMVDNSLGQLWKEARPDTKLTDGLKFYIKPQNPELIPPRKVSSPEHITFFDPCVGSAHVLCYAFDLFYKMYEEEGYNPSEIPALILSKNLYGIDIDDRAAQLAGFALMMKGRMHNRRFLRKTTAPNVTAYQNIASHPKFENAKVLGSLIKITKDEVEDIIVDETSLFGERDIQLKKQASLLADRYDIVVTNPPYLNSSNMESTLKQFVEKEYKETKSDLFACFLTQVSNFTKEEGLIGFICPYVWLYTSTYKLLRFEIQANQTITSLVQLEYNAFGPAVVPICTFTMRNELLDEYQGTYISLANFTGIDNQSPRTKEAIESSNSEYKFLKDQKMFSTIPGSPFLFSLSDKMLDNFGRLENLGDWGVSKSGLQSGDNNRFLRRWFEVSYREIHSIGSDNSNKWVIHPKGGPYKRWFGNLEYVLKWKNNGAELRNFEGTSIIKNEDYYFKEAVSWSHTSSSYFSSRILPSYGIFNVEAPSFFTNKIENWKILGILNSKITTSNFGIISPTMHYLAGDIVKLPVPKPSLYSEASSVINSLINTAKSEWRSREFSWEFKRPLLLNHLVNSSIEESLETYQQALNKQIFNYWKNEEINNLEISKLFDLEEHDYIMSFKDLTIYDDIISNKSTKEDHIINLDFSLIGIMSQLISYAVGCMLGRYSLDKEGLILANQGETLEDYLDKIGQGETEVSFLPDDDNIIPILDDEWFEDDIVGRFYEFLKVTFGTQDFDKNLAFVEDCLGKDIRKYFVRDFYKDHVKRYKTRPIYWQFSSPKGAFNVLVYMHRYTPDTLNNILNGYLKEYRAKLNRHLQHLDHLIEAGSSSEQTKAAKEKDKLKLVLLELQEYERDILYPLATERIEIDLDDGVLVNYNKFGEAIKKVAGLNDKKAKDKVRKFDWIDTAEII